MASRPAKKRRTDNQNYIVSSAPITNAKELQSAMSDYGGAGLKGVKAFLIRCTKSEEVEEAEATAKRAILKGYMETQCQNAGKEEEYAEKEMGSFNDIIQIWGYANQNNTITVLSLVPATLSNLIRLCSYHEEFRGYGSILIKSLLQPTVLKIIYRGLTGTKDHVVSPCLRMLTEMNRFNFGSMCSFVHSAFDFTIKDLPRNLDVKGSTRVSVEDPARPSVRTLFVRFFLSFLQNGEPSIRAEVLGLRTWITPIFKHLRMDTPSIVHDLLECMAIKVLAEKEIPRVTKTNVFNEWVLAHILGLYVREDAVKVSRAGKHEDKQIADLAHEFLLNVCTKRGSGICFPDHGWYPPGYSEGEDKRRTAPKVYNRTLSSLVASIRPFADMMQLELILEIFKICPELVADHFLSNTSFSFDPKLTSTWIGYCTFLLSTVTLPIPDNFGAPAALALPPPKNVVVENILPKPLSKTALTKSLTHENSLIRFLTTRLLITAFQKLRSVLKALESASASIHDPAQTWKKCRFDVIEEFCRRIPDASVISSVGAGKTDTDGVLQTEAKMRLLADYYATVPEIALSGKFDINVALSNFLGSEDGDQKGIRLLEMGHLLKIAKEVPDVKWWNKTPAMKHSPFVAILKLCCSSSATNAPQQRVQELLHSFASTSYLFQAETTSSPLDALLESLSTIEDKGDLEAILSLLDEVVARCIRGPFKYLDDYAEVAAKVGKQRPEPLLPVSPVVMTLVEQWKFFMQSKEISSQQKASGVRWLLRFLESCALLGENKYVLAALCDRMMTDSAATKEGLSKLKKFLQKNESLELMSSNESPMVGVRHLFARLPERYINIQMIPLLTESVLHHRIKASVFDLAVVQRAIAEIVKSKKINNSDATAAVVKLNVLMKYIAFQLIGQGDEDSVTKKTKLFVTRESACLQLFLDASMSTDKIPLVVELSHGYAELLAVIFNKNDPILEPVKQKLTNIMFKFVDVFETLPEEDTLKLLFIYRSMITLLHRSSDVNGLTKRLCSESSLIKDRTLSQLFAFLLHLSADRGDVIHVKIINRLLKVDNMTSCVSSALMAYISKTRMEDLNGINYPQTTSPEQMAVMCSLIPKVEIIRDSALNQLDKDIRTEDTVQMISERILALLEAFSMSITDTTKFTWAGWTDETVKTKLQNIFNVAQRELLQAAPTPFQVNILRRAASLFPSLDRKQVLRHMATDRKRSVLTEDTISLIDALVEDSDDASIPEMKRWFLMVFDHLTRCFAEDAVLSNKVTAFAKALGGFVVRKEISLEKVVPRTALNAVLEAGLQKHISVPEVIYFVVSAVSVSSPKSLDFAKLLQMVLGNTENPLAHRAIYSAENIHHYMAILILRLFRAGKASLCNIATLDGVLVLYRGTNDPIDTSILDVITHIEGHLARSCASRISSWSIMESTDKFLVSRTRGRLEVSINAKILARSVFHTIPNTTSYEFKNLDTYLRAIKDNAVPVGKAYDPRFMLPVLTFCLVSETHIMEAQGAVDRHCVGYAIACLSSEDAAIQKMAAGFLSTVASKLEDSPYRGKIQISHLLLGLLASLSSRDKGTEDMPLPSAMGIFLAQATQVLANPTHFLYEKVMELLLRHPLLQLYDLPFMLSTLQVGEEHHKEVTWILNILTAGLKTEQDLLLYRKRNVFGNILTLYTSPNCTERTREKVLELLWNAAATEGGGTTLITRNGVVAWIEQQLGLSQEKDLTLKRLAARLYEGSAKDHVKDWSRGNLSAHFVGEKARLGADIVG